SMFSMIPSRRVQKDPPYVRRPGHRLFVGRVLLDPASRFRRMLDRQIDAIAPLFPRADIIARTRIAEQPKREIRVSRAIAALTVRNHFLVARDARELIHLAQLVLRLEGSAGIQSIL